MIEVNEKVAHILSGLPTTSGVYIMRDKTGDIIYIGKAKILKNRVSSYFQSAKKTLKTTLMVEKVDSIDYILTASEQDAFSLENNLIKEHKPKYNILLKDDKFFPYIRIDKKERFPQIKVVRKVVNDGALYFGPYVTGMRVSEFISTIKLVFPIRQCTTNFSKQQTKKRPCLFGDMKKCTMPCTGKISNEEYLKIIDKVIEFLNGKNAEVKRILKNKMQECSNVGDFEHAIDYRNKLEIIEKSETQIITSLDKATNLDAFSIVNSEDVFAINKMIIRNGKTIADTTQIVEPLENDQTTILSAFIVEYYEKNSIPSSILTNVEMDSSLENYLSQMLSKKIVVSSPKIGVRKRIVEMGEKNALNFINKNLEVFNAKQLKCKNALLELARVLNLPELPNRMECYDISNISGQDSVSSMVVFEGGMPAPKEYRKFKIKTVEGANDFASMAETLKRRLSHLNEVGSHFTARPDLIVIDGGLGQLHSAVDAMQEMGYSIPIISLAKREEEIFVPDSNVSIKLDERNSARKLLQQIRDEAHRFAITYHRKLHLKNTLKK